MKKLEKNKGITLIALIITIIVMLILVGVTVNVALNGGLFKKAKEAAVKTDRAVEEEKEMEIALEIEMAKEDLLKNYNIGDAEWVDNGLVLENLDICSLYEDILENYYDSSYDELTLKTAIKATNKLYQICNPVVKNIINEDDGSGYWNGLSYATLSGGQEITEEQMYKLYAIAYSWMLSESNDLPEMENRNITIGKTKYFVLSVYDSEEINLIDDEQIFRNLFPGGSFPFDKFSEEISINLSDAIGLIDRCKSNC